MEGSRLIIEPSNPYADILSPPEDIDPDLPTFKVRNTWYSSHWRCNIHIVELPDGRFRAVKIPAFHHIDLDMATMAAADVWGIEQESNAINLLATMIPHFHFKRYLMTGMFMERSKRSNIIYVFRRLKPTVALQPFRGDGHPDQEAKILCCLCMHPIAYYEGSWAGAMVPTDDVIAHLSLMRADEHMFWKRCNQHPAYRPEAGL